MAAGLGGNNMTTTTNASFIPEIWGSKLNDFYRANLKAAAFFEDLSDELTDGGDIIHIPNISEMTANSKTVGSQVTLNEQTAASVTLTINAWYEVSFLLEDFVAAVMKKSYRMQERWMKNAGYTVAAVLEDAIFTLFESFSQVVGDSAHSFNDSSIRTAIQYLEAANVPQNDRAFFLHPNVIWGDIMGIDKFTLVQNTGGADPVLKGEVGKLYGIPVISSTRLGTTATPDRKRSGALAGADAINFATANPASGTSPDKVRLQTQYLQDYLGWLVTADIMYGVIENRDTSGVWISVQV